MRECWSSFFPPGISLKFVDYQSYKGVIVTTKTCDNLLAYSYTVYTMLLRHALHLKAFDLKL